MRKASEVIFIYRLDPTLEVVSKEKKEMEQNLVSPFIEQS